MSILQEIKNLKESIKEYENLVDNMKKKLLETENELLSLFSLSKKGGFVDQEYFQKNIVIQNQEIKKDSDDGEGIEWCQIGILKNVKNSVQLEACIMTYISNKVYITDFLDSLFLKKLQESKKIYYTIFKDHSGDFVVNFRF